MSASKVTIDLDSGGLKCRPKQSIKADLNRIPCDFQLKVVDGNRLKKYVTNTSYPRGVVISWKRIVSDTSATVLFKNRAPLRATGVPLAATGAAEVLNMSSSWPSI